jgi:hypothetical protein
MSLLYRVSEKDREVVAEEFDTRGPKECLAEIVEHLEHENPEFLDMASRCAADLGKPAKLMVGFGIFYRLLASGRATGSARALMMVPRVSVDARERVVAEIDTRGPEDFTKSALAELEAMNPELFQMAHHFASGVPDYLHAMQGFALLHRSLVIQSTLDRGPLH